MTAFASRLCPGIVVHRRYRPKHHGLRYRVLSLLVDLDEAAQLSDRLRLFSFNRSNLFSIHEKDHGEPDDGCLKDFIADKARAADPDANIDRVVMLCFPRVLGYVFNPLTVYYCYCADDELRSIVYEVNNTFGERHHYALPVQSRPGQTLAQSCSKKLYVSPFNAVEGAYEFHVSPPGKQLAVGVNLRVDGAPVLKAYLSARLQPLTDRALLNAFVRMPAMTFKVVAAIHWEALLLWLKGLPVARRAGRTQPLRPLPIKNKSNS